jgi:hypothetical protein
MSDPLKKEWALSLEIEPYLSDFFVSPDRPIPSDIVGAKILGIGRSKTPDNLEECGLIIDYLPCDNAVPKRLVLGFNELSIWVSLLTEKE